MNLTTIAKEMSAKYKEDELKWLLVLKRLEFNGYDIIKTFTPKEQKTSFVCSNCGKELKPDNYGLISEFEGKLICPNCQLKILFNRKPLSSNDIKGDIKHET